ncbi:PAS domain-containing protein [Aurantimonas endophytica]|uniref:Blue-light-activated histidine kinase n=1 Tax=Aurantimonas endophytica TaxID=1522175 RepID=A0A7W6H9R7_9HYPH|nr:PAS domain-containing protein [Aurantimonas endophytica]MBB4001239.1 PAS domain S-box-containing protein [Aurantimonas endophytica]MCO6403112.1 PAS domain-containing protein [Aurantimonas endophytica]
MDAVVGAAFKGDAPAASQAVVLPDRRELALVAVERTRMPMVVSDARQPDCPIVLANRAFLALTGYSAEEVIGRNCRFLQGPDTDPSDVEAIRQGLRAGTEDLEVELLNYRKDGSAFWNQLAISPVIDEMGEVIYYFASQKDVTARRRAEQMEATERLLLREVDHRAMNALALVQSFVNLSKADTATGYATAIRERVETLARAHRLLGEAGWSGVDLACLLAAETPEEIRECVGANGTPIQLPTPLVQPIALVLHELMTNARRHGSLRDPSGTVGVEWVLQSQSLLIRWRETGAHDVAEPTQAGVGIRMLEGVVTRQLGGAVKWSWPSSGVCVELEVPLETAE